LKHDWLCFGCLYMDVELDNLTVAVGVVHRSHTAFFCDRAIFEIGE